MGFLDKAKAAATQAVQQGQAKVSSYQQGRSEAELYRSLGEAVYQEQRHGGDPAAVSAAFTALDAHFEQVAQEAAAAAAAAPAGAPAAPAAAQSTPAQDAAPAGNFTLDDV